MAEYGPKPKQISTFWKVEVASQHEMVEVAKFLEYLNTPSKSMGGRKRAALVLGSDGGRPELGLIAGSDGRGGVAPIMFRLSDAR